MIYMNEMKWSLPRWVTLLMELMMGITLVICIIYFLMSKHIYCRWVRDWKWNEQLLGSEFLFSVYFNLLVYNPTVLMSNLDILESITALIVCFIEWSYSGVYLHPNSCPAVCTSLLCLRVKFIIQACFGWSFQFPHVCFLCGFLVDSIVISFYS